MPPTVQPANSPPTAPAMNGAPPCGHFASLVRSVASLLARLPSEAKLLRRIFITHSTQDADNSGDDENKPVQANPVTVKVPVK